MNVNSTIIGLKSITGLDVEQDEYSGKDAEYIVFTYADERYADFGDDAPISEVVDVQIKFVFKKTTNYFSIKEKAKAYLLDKGAYDLSGNSYIEDVSDGSKVRNVIIEAKFKEVINNG